MVVWAAAIDRPKFGVPPIFPNDNTPVRPASLLDNVIGCLLHGFFGFAKAFCLCHGLTILYCLENPLVKFGVQWANSSPVIIASKLSRMQC